MDEQSNVGRELGRVSSLAVVLSMLACYGTLAVNCAPALLGITVDIHESAWAAAIATFAWLAFFGIAQREYFFSLNRFLFLARKPY